MTSNKVLEFSRNPAHRGAIFRAEAEEKDLALLDAKSGSVKFYLLADPESDRILDARFFTYGGPLPTALAELACARMEGDTLDSALSLKVDELEKALRDDASVPVFEKSAPETTLFTELFRNLEKQYPEQKAVALAAAAARAKSPDTKNAFEARTEEDMLWQKKSTVEKIATINEILDKHVRDGLRMDGGDVEVLDVIDEVKVRVRYQGACNGCGAATGGTLFYMENALRQHAYHALTVEPEL